MDTDRNCAISSTSNLPSRVALAYHICLNHLPARGCSGLMSAETHKCIISVLAGLNVSEFQTRGERFWMRQCCLQCTYLDANQDFEFPSARGDCAIGTRRFLTLTCLQTSHHLKWNGTSIQPITASIAMQSSHSLRLLSVIILRNCAVSTCAVSYCVGCWQRKDDSSEGIKPRIGY
jgi:hypothetical protein